MSSLLRTKGVQIGQDNTASNNFTLYQPGVPDGTLRIGNGNSGSTTDALTINSSGNVGIGTSSPSVLLHLKGSNFSSAIRWEETSGNNNFYVGPLNASGDFGIDNNSTSGYIRLVTNSTERMRIDSAGRVTMPYQPYFYAMSSVTRAAGSVYIGDLVDHNDGNHYNSTNGVFTAPVTGKYFFSFNGNSADATSAIQFYFRKNGSEVYGSRVYDKTGDDPSNISLILKLSASDYIDVYLSGHSVTGSPWSHFSGYLIG